MARKAFNGFHVRTVTHEGRRGRPAHPHPFTERRERILSANNIPLGDIELSPNADGSVTLTAIQDGKKRTITFAAAKAAAPVRKAKPRTRKAA